MHNDYSYKKSYLGGKYKKKSDNRLKVISIISVPVFLLGAGSAAKKVDARTDHTTSICWFTSTCHNLGLNIGTKHQIKEIEKAGYDAYYQREKISRYYQHSIEISLQDGYYIYREKLIPEGFLLLDKPHDGYDCYREECDPEAIVVQKNNKIVRKLAFNKKK